MDSPEASNQMLCDSSRSGAICATVSDLLLRLLLVVTMLLGVLTERLVVQVAITNSGSGPTVDAPRCSLNAIKLRRYL
jgi:hypothetical protein